MFNGNQPRILIVSSQDASTQRCVGARFVVMMRSEYTQTDSVVSPVPQLVKTFTIAETPVKLITESPDGANTGPSSHSSHFKNSGWIYPDYRPVDCDKSDKKKQESEENIDSDSKPKKPTLFELVYPSGESPNDPPLSPPWLPMAMMMMRNTRGKWLTMQVRLRMTQIVSYILRNSWFLSPA